MFIYSLYISINISTCFIIEKEREKKRKVLHVRIQQEWGKKYISSNDNKCHLIRMTEILAITRERV
jgi:hypothetical protein